MTSAMLIVWELFGQSYSFDTPLLMVSSTFKIETGQAFALLAGLIIASAIFWSYLIGSFVDAKKILLEQKKLRSKQLKCMKRKEKMLRENPL